MDHHTATSPRAWTRPCNARRRIETDRLVIRPWCEDDADAAFRLVESCRDDLGRWMPWVDQNRDLAACRSNIGRLAACHDEAEPDQLAYALFDPAGGEPLGGAGFHSFRRETAQAQFGYWLGAGHRGKGLASEAARAMLDFGFDPPESGGLGLRRVEIRCAASNAASRAVPERLGMRLEATLRSERWVPGVGWDDGLIYAVLEPEWPLSAG